MGKINVDEIRGYHIGEEIVCDKCVTQDDENDLAEDSILTENDLDGDDLYFCDRCKKKMN